MKDAFGQGIKWKYMDWEINPDEIDRIEYGFQPTAVELCVMGTVYLKNGEELPIIEFIHYKEKPGSNIINLPQTKDDGRRKIIEMFEVGEDKMREGQFNPYDLFQRKPTFPQEADTSKAEA